MTAHAPGRYLTLAAINVGWRAYSNRRYYADHSELPSPVGGTVVEVINGSRFDLETGEITPTTRYLCLDYRGDRQLLDAEEIDLGCLESLDRHACWTAADRLVATVAKRRTRKRSRWDDTDIADLRCAWNLLVASL